MMMRTLFVGLLAGMLLLTGCGSGDEPAGNTDAAREQANAKANLAKAIEAGEGQVLKVFHVEGMTCEGCASTIYAELNKMEPVKDLSVSVNAKTAWLVFASDNVPSDEEISAKVKEIGQEHGMDYKATPVSAEGADDLKDQLKEAAEDKVKEMTDKARETADHHMDGAHDGHDAGEHEDAMKKEMDEQMNKLPGMGG